MEILGNWEKNRKFFRENDQISLVVGALTSQKRLLAPCIYEHKLLGKHQLLHAFVLTAYEITVSISPSDGLHLTPEGNALVHKEVVQALRGAGLKPEDMPHDFPHHSKIDGIHPEKAFQ